MNSQYTNTSTAVEEILTQRRKDAKTQGKHRLFFAPWRLCVFALNPVAHSINQHEHGSLLRVFHYVFKLPLSAVWWSDQLEKSRISACKTTTSMFLPVIELCVRRLR
jgi:hypothetical protein